MNRRENTFNKLLVIFAILFVILVAICVMALVLNAKLNNVGDTSSVVSQNTSDISSVESNASSREDTSSDAFLNDTSVTDETSESSVNSSASVDDWQLILANSTHVVTDYVPELSVIEERFCQGSGYRFDARAYKDLLSMLYDAEESGVDLYILSSYRTYEYQTTLYNNKIAYYKNQGYSDEESVEKAAAVVAVPGTSDHNLGLACDFNYLEQEYEDTEELVWLRENAEKYGFVMRYPENKEDITGIIYEPWHYRYVGRENAEIMNELDMCLEEYIEYLQN